LISSIQQQSPLLDAPDLLMQSLLEVLSRATGTSATFSSNRLGLVLLQIPRVLFYFFIFIVKLSLLALIDLLSLRLQILLIWVQNLVLLLLGAQLVL